MIPVSGIAKTLSQIPGAAMAAAMHQLRMPAAMGTMLSPAQALDSILSKNVAAAIALGGTAELFKGITGAAGTVGQQYYAMVFPSTRGKGRGAAGGADLKKIGAID